MTKVDTVQRHVAVGDRGGSKNVPASMRSGSLRAPAFIYLFRDVDLGSFESFDGSAHLLQHPSQIRELRFARGILDNGLCLSRARRAIMRFSVAPTAG